MEIKGIKAY